MVWGNNSQTIYPDIRHATIKEKFVSDIVDPSWINDDFIPYVQQRGKDIVRLKKLSPAASAGKAVVD